MLSKILRLFTSAKGRAKPSAEEGLEDKQVGKEKVNKRGADIEVAKSVRKFKQGFDNGQFSIKGSEFESRNEAIESYQNLIRDLDDEQKMMELMKKYGVGNSNKYRRNASINNGIVDYDRDEAIRRDR